MMSLLSILLPIVLVLSVAQALRLRRRAPAPHLSDAELLAPDGLALPLRDPVPTTQADDPMDLRAMRERRVKQWRKA